MAEGTEVFGPWMMVKRKPRSRNPRREVNGLNQGIGTVPNREVQKDKPATNVSRFAAIADLDTELRNPRLSYLGGKRRRMRFFTDLKGKKESPV